MFRLRETRLAAHLSVRRLTQLEALAQMAQGKGYSSSVDEEVATVCQLLGPRADRRLVVLDVGANVGAWAVHALRALPEATVHSFEPSSAAFAKLSAAIGGEARVTLHQLAISDTDREAVLYANQPGSPLSSLTRRELEGIEFSHEEHVRTTTLDAWARSVGLKRADVLKLDVEGHEMAALRGARCLLEEVQVIQFEFGGCHVDARTFFRDLWGFLTDSGFRIYRLGPSGVRALEAYSERDEVFVTTNYFAVR